jgi:beta-lactamase class A
MEAGVERLAVAYYDYDSRTGWTYNGDAWFHAASTIKLPILLGVFDAIDRGVLSKDSRVHVRNRFIGAADGLPFRVEADRDADAEVYRALGRTLRIRELVRPMITTSSNLATNLLLDVVGLEEIQKTLRRLGLKGIELRRGVEDERAWEAGINNRVTADGLICALRLLAEERAFSTEASRDMLEILHEQEFRRGIPAGLPAGARVAHKTGEISTVAHDAGVVYLPDREPYAVAILTEWEAGSGGRHETIANISKAIYEVISEGEGDHD